MILISFCSIVPNLLEYECAKNYQNRSSFDKVIAKIKWRSFSDSLYIFATARQLYAAVITLCRTRVQSSGVEITR